MPLTFRDIAVSDIPLISGRVRKAGLCASQYSYYNLFCLREKYGAQICADDDALYIRQKKRDDGRLSAYLYPVSESSGNRALERILAHAKAMGQYPLFWGVTREQADELERTLPGRFLFEETRDWADYLYRADELYAAMKKSAVFERRQSGRYACEEIGKGNLPEIAEFSDWWMEQNCMGNDDAQSLVYERAAIGEALSNWDALGLHGLCVRLDGRVAGFSFTVDQTADYATGHVMKVDKRYRGLSLFMGKSGLMRVGKPFVNLEEDIGIIGLRKFKLELKPFRLLEKFKASYIAHE